MPLHGDFVRAKSIASFAQLDKKPDICVAIGCLLGHIKASVNQREAPKENRRRGTLQVTTLQENMHNF